MPRTILDRVVRRETHSPRSVASVVVLLATAIAATYVGVEIVLHVLGASAFLVSPGNALTWLQKLPDQPQGLVVTIGLLVAIIGILLLWFALAPGRKPKHQLGGSPYAVLVDNGVIASSVAEQLRREFDLADGAVVVGIGHRHSDITVRPEPGQIVDQGRVRAHAQAQLDGYALSPRVKARARILDTTRLKAKG